MSLIWRWLETRDRRRLIFLSLAFFLSAGIEGLAVAMVFPFISLVGGSLNPSDSWFISSFVSILPPALTSHLIISLGAFLLFVYILKNLLAGCLTYLQYDFSDSCRRKVAAHLLEGHLRGRYIFTLDRNSNETLKILLDETYSVFDGVLVSSIVIWSEALVVTTIFSLLIFVDVRATLGSAILMTLSFVFYYFLIQKRIEKLGLARQDVGFKILHSLSDTIRGIKEIKLLGREDFFLKHFDTYLFRFGHTLKLIRTYADLPRFFTETIAISGLLLICLLVFIGPKSQNMLMPTVGLFAAAMFRLLPSFGRIFHALGYVAYSSPSADLIDRERRAIISRKTEALPVMTSSQPIRFREQIEVKKLQYSYPRISKSVLQDLSFTIPRNSSFGICGPSGVGKTTLIDILLGLLEPMHGGVFVDGQNIWENIQSWQRLIGYVPQTTFLLDGTIKDNIAFGLDPAQIREEKIWSALERAQLFDFVKSLPYGLDHLIGEGGAQISGGQRQRLGIARALYSQSEILVLDEATSSLDAQTEANILKEIFDLGDHQTLIVVSHKESVIAGCSQILDLSHLAISLSKGA